MSTRFSDDAYDQTRDLVLAWLRLEPRFAQGPQTALLFVALRLDHTPGIYEVENRSPMDGPTTVVLEACISRL